MLGLTLCVYFFFQLTLSLGELRVPHQSLDASQLSVVVSPMSTFFYEIPNVTFFW
jgi:hypothetical protein